MITILCTVLYPMKKTYNSSQFPWGFAVRAAASSTRPPRSPVGRGASPCALLVSMCSLAKSMFSSLKKLSLVASDGLNPIFLLMKPLYLFCWNIQYHDFLLLKSLGVSQNLGWTSSYPSYFDVNKNMVFIHSHRSYYIKVAFFLKLGVYQNQRLSSTDPHIKYQFHFCIGQTR